MAQNQIKNNSGVSNQALKINFSDPGLALQLFGQHDSHLQKIAAALDLNINTRGNTVFIQGEPIVSTLAENILNQLYGLLEENYPIHPNDIDYAITALSGNDKIKLKEIFLDTVYVKSKKSLITPKSPVQKDYIDAIR